MDLDTFAARTEAARARLYRTAYLYLGSEADALEAVDEAVYQALRALKKLREPDFFETWLTRIVLNECRRELRRRRRLTGEDALPGVLLAGARYREGLTQAQLAEKTGLPRRHISEMENGKRPVGKKNARILGDALGIEPRLLLTV